MECDGLCHLHLTLNSRVKMKKKALTRETCERFVSRLLKAAEMKPLGPLNYAEAEDRENPGQSFVQMITTSHCSLHYFSKEGEIYFDLYSCKKFNPAKIISLLKREFKFVKCTSSICERVPCYGGKATLFRNLS